VGDDYALLAKNPADVQRASEAVKTKGALSADKTFASDMSALDSGVAAFWLNTGSLSRILSPTLAVTGSEGALKAAGRTTYVLRFDGPDVLELVGKVSGATSAPFSLGAVQGMDTLPSSTVAAFGLADGRKAIGPAFDSVRRTVDRTQGKGSYDRLVAQLEAQYAIRLPDDLQTLLGTNLVAALDRSGLAQGQVSVAARVSTDGARAVAVLDKLTASQPVVVAYRRVPDGYVIGSDQRALGRIGGGGSLGSDDRFTKALPDLKGSSVAVYVDLAALVDALAPSNAQSELAPLDAVGVTASNIANGSGSFRLRLVAR
jgi:hypothetical protein